MNYLGHGLCFFWYKVSAIITHLHSLATDGCFYNDAAFMVCPPPDTVELEDLFRHEVFKMLKSEGKINELIIENMTGWRHSGFNVYCGKVIWAHNEDGLENLTRYIIRASFSQERMTYIAADDSADGTAKVIFDSAALKKQLLIYFIFHFRTSPSHKRFKKSRTGRTCTSSHRAARSPR